MSENLLLYKSEGNEFDDFSFVDYYISSITREPASTLLSLSAPLAYHRRALLATLRERCKRFEQKKESRIFWVPPFYPWEMQSLGNLSPVILWHLYKSLPDSMHIDEKTIFKLGKISLTLPAFTELYQQGNMVSEINTTSSNEFLNKSLSKEKKSSVSSVFSICDQIQELTDAFNSISKQICSNGNFDCILIPIIDLDRCFPQLAISLLFAIKNFMCSEFLRFIVIADNDILSASLNSVYQHGFSSEQSKIMLLSFFDAFTQPPTPSIQTILQSFNNKQVSKAIPTIIRLITSSGVLPLLTDMYKIRYTLLRYQSFIGNQHTQFSYDEYALLALLFLVGTARVDALKKLSVLPDLEFFIKKIRETKSLQPSFDETTFPISYFEIIYKDNNLLPTFFANIPQSVNNTRIAEFIRKIISFL